MNPIPAPIPDWQQQFAINARSNMPVYGVTEFINVRQCQTCGSLVSGYSQNEHTNSHLLEKLIVDQINYLIHRLGELAELTHDQGRRMDEAEVLRSISGSVAK